MPTLSSAQLRCFNASYTQLFQFANSDVCFNEPIDSAPSPQLIALPGCHPIPGTASSQRSFCNRASAYEIRGETYTTFYEYQNPVLRPDAAQNMCIPGGSDVYIYDQLGPPERGKDCWPFLTSSAGNFGDAGDLVNTSSITWSCDAQMTTYIDSSGPACQTSLAASWSATPAPVPSPPAFPSQLVAPPVIAYSSPYDGSECVR